MAFPYDGYSMVRSGTRATSARIPDPDSFTLADLFAPPDPGDVRTFWSGRSGDGIPSGYMSLDDYNKRHQRTVLQYLGKQAEEQSNLADKGYESAIAALKGLGGKTDEYFGKADQFYGQAGDVLEAERGRLGDWLDQLKGWYGDIIPQTIQQAQAGVLSENPDYAGEQARAEATVASQMEGQKQQFQRNLGRYGTNPYSSRYAGVMRDFAMQSAAERAAAREKARLSERDRVERAKQVNFAARAGLTNLGQGALDRANAALTGVAGSEANLLTSRGQLQVHRAGLDTDIASRLAQVEMGLGDRRAKAASDTANLMAQWSFKNPVSKAASGRGLYGI